MELGSRKVDRHVEVLEPRGLVTPCGQLAQGLFEHPLPDPHDQPALLGQGDELDGRDDPQGGVGPSDEGLDAFDGSVGNADDGLVDEMELTQLDGSPQVVLELDTLGDLRPHRLVEHRHRVPAGVLGLVHGGVGVPDEDLGVGIGVVTRREGQADAGRDVELHLVDDERRPEAEAQPVGEVERLGHAHDLAEDDHEFVPADPGHEIGRSHVRVQPPGHGDEQFVTMGVPEGVVDELEAVEVEEQQRDVGVVDRGLLRARS